MNNLSSDKSFNALRFAYSILVIMSSIAKIFPYYYDKNRTKFISYKLKTLIYIKKE